MKAKRHAKILELIHNHPIATQEGLLQLLLESGYSVTQATISRDIRELRLIKATDKDGAYRYTVVQKDGGDISSKFHALFTEIVLGVDIAMNLVVVKCLPGMAMSACAAVDSLHRTDIVGTISGDDTFVCITKGENMAAALAAELKKMTK